MSIPKHQTTRFPPQCPQSPIANLANGTWLSRVRSAESETHYSAIRQRGRAELDRLIGIVAQTANILLITMKMM
jgi:hypothetical protein